MWEFSLCIDGMDKDFVEEHKDKLDAKFRSFGGFVTEFEDISHYILFVAKNHENQAKNIVRSFIIEAINEVEKRNFFVKHFKYPTSNKWKYEAVMQALITFDKNVDDKYISKRLIIGSDLNIHSFVRFACKELVVKWTNLAMVTNNSSIFLNYEDAYAEIVNFLIDNVPKTEPVSIVESGKVFVMTDRRGNVLSSVASSQTSEVIKWLIRRNPTEISISSSNKEFVLFVKYLFCNRVVFVKQEVSQKIVDNT